MEETVTVMATGCLRMVKMDIFSKGLFLVNNEKMELCLYIIWLLHLFCHKIVDKIQFITGTRKNTILCYETLMCYLA